jgi:DNA-binding transcriptional LysR family regulator
MSNTVNGEERYDFHMDLRRLRYFVAVAEELHFGRAAERLGMSQPPLTQQIQKFEAELGCRLFKRGRRTELTEAGAVLFGQARILLDEAERAVDAARRASRGETGRITIAVPPSVMLTSLPSAIRQYRERYSDVEFRLLELSTSAIEEAVRAGRVDVGFLREARPGPPLVSEVVYFEPLVAVVPDSHPAARRGKPSLAMLRADPFVFFSRRLGPAFYDRLTACCTAAGFLPRIAQEATQWQTIVALVEAGVGVSIAPAGVRKFGWRGVATLPLPGAETAILACRRDEELSPAAERFLALAKKSFGLSRRERLAGHRS